jgi:hypothetical protein
MNKDSSQTKILFLLGGLDLEMQTIESLLIDFGFEDITKYPTSSKLHCFANKNLKWGASLNEYNEFLDFDGNIYGVELIENETDSLPKNYTRIDHHNELSHKPSSLHQICAILNITMNRYLNLVAANDTGYIPAMEAIGASNEEIEQIRRADRAAQGVSLIDEELAEQSIKNNFSKVGEIKIIKSLTPKYSPITDRLYPFKQLLIYDAEQFVYYGVGTKNIIKNFGHFITEKKMFYGGGENGFIGSNNKSFTENELNLLIVEIINICREI